MKVLEVGERVPPFNVKDHDGVAHAWNDYRGKKVIVFFYPRANTDGCTAEVCNLRDHYTALQEQGYALLGVSEDSQRKQKNFHQKHSLPFPLLADTDHAVIDAFGVWGPKKFMGRAYEGIHRITFVVDEEGIVEKRIDKVNTKDHAAQLL